MIVNNGSSANPISTKLKPHDLALNNLVHRHLFPPRQGLKRPKYRTQHTEVKRSVCPDIISTEGNGEHPILSHFSLTPEIKTWQTSLRLEVGLLVPDWRLETRLHELQNDNNMAAKCHETAVTRRPAAAPEPDLPKAGIPTPDLVVYKSIHGFISQAYCAVYNTAHIIAQPIAQQCNA